MYGDQVLLVMHHRLALVTLNLEQLAQEVPLTERSIKIKIIIYFQITQKNYK
jgi:hypothetical protein